MKYILSFLIAAMLISCKSTTSFDATSSQPVASATPTPGATPTPAPTATPAEQNFALNSANFKVDYDGFGYVDISAAGIVLSPQASTQLSETHAALVRIQDTIDNPVRDFELTIDMTTNEMLRQNNPPNGWEVFWLFFNYNPTPDGKKTTNYFMSKPTDGAEIGTASEELAQIFLGTDSSKKTPLMERHIFKYRRVGASFTVHRDGVLFYSYTDTKPAPNKMFDDKGSIGFYVEDAKATIYSVKLLRLD